MASLTRSVVPAAGAPQRRPARPGGCARWRRVDARPDAGGATAELDVAMPLLLLMVMFIVQAGVWMHAIHVAQAAATRAANTAASYKLRRRRVEVEGTAETVVPGIHWPAKAVVVRPIEQFIPDTAEATP